ncbi:MAG: hypothetical protein J4428_01130 [Candidatus Aenigmarchaeota archaeon]|nr:hypothetical protein [Candidatus Aenigmarchaeota archaeon]
MSLEGSSKIFKHTKAKTYYITIPASLADDSSFPFKAGDKVKIKIKDSKLLIEK